MEHVISGGIVAFCWSCCFTPVESYLLLSNTKWARTSEIL